MDTFFAFLLGLLIFSVAAAATAHVILYKRASRAAVGWVGIIWLAPVVGTVVYLLLGINRIRRRATRLRADMDRQAPRHDCKVCGVEDLAACLGPGRENLVRMAAKEDGFLRWPMVDGNAVAPLDGGDAAFGSMLEAIEDARRSIGLMTYIFDHDAAGLRFRDALAAASGRGVDVRVLVDAVGMRYSKHSMVAALRDLGLRADVFLPTRLPWHGAYLNLRNHRKVLVVDGRVGFTGGMNIRAGHQLSLRPGFPVRDLHFRLEGPIVQQLAGVFREDWAFTTRETLDGEAWFPAIEPAGDVVARGVSDGPDADMDHLRLAIMAALANARDRVRVVTPYFLPDEGLETALMLAAMRGASVEILLPAKNNLALVQWASMAHLGPLLARGCRVRLSPPPFDHSKLMLVDGAWSLIGSANWDPRSLRLNFEFNVGCYSTVLAAELGRLVDERWAASRELTTGDLDGRSIFLKLRDGTARLLSPYL